MNRFKQILLSSACLVMTTGIAFADEKPADVAGDWALTIESPQGTRTPTVTLEQDGGALTGVYHGQRGDTPLTGTVAGKKVDFNVKLSLGGQDLVINYNGTVTGADMAGKVKMGDMGEADFTGKKK